LFSAIWHCSLTFRGGVGPADPFGFLQLHQLGQ
jgi:hypothetical protein